MLSPLIFFSFSIVPANFILILRMVIQKIFTLRTSRGFSPRYVPLIYYHSSVPITAIISPFRSIVVILIFVIPSSVLLPFYNSNCALNVAEHFLIVFVSVWIFLRSCVWSPRFVISLLSLLAEKLIPLCRYLWVTLNCMFGRIYPIKVFWQLRRAYLSLCKTFCWFRFIEPESRSVFLLETRSIYAIVTNKHLTGAFHEDHIFRLLTIAFFRPGFGVIDILGIRGVLDSLKPIEIVLIGVNIVSVEVFGEDVIPWKNFSDFLFLTAFYFKVLVQDLRVEVTSPVIGELGLMGT